MRPKNYAPFTKKFSKLGRFLLFSKSNQLAVGAATFIEKRRAGGDIMGALPPNPRPWRALTASLIVKVLCGALLAVGAAISSFSDCPNGLAYL